MTNSFISVATCAGHFITPQIVKFLLIENGFKGACLIYGGLVLNTIVGGALLHPVEWHAKVSWGSKTNIHEPPKIDFKDETKTNIKTQLPNSTSLNLFPSLHKSSTSLTLSSLKIPEISQNDQYNLDKNKNSNETESKGIKKTILDICFYFLILRDLRAIIISFGLAFTLTGYINFLMMLPFIFQNKGFTLGQSAWCISTSAIFNMIAGLVSSTASDNPKFNKKACYMSGSAISCISTIRK